MEPWLFLSNPFSSQKEVVSWAGLRAALEGLRVAVFPGDPEGRSGALVHSSLGSAPGSAASFLGEVRDIG